MPLDLVPTIFKWTYAFLLTWNKTNSRKFYQITKEKYKMEHNGHQTVNFSENISKEKNRV